jgi:hypothetical protein
MRFKSMTKKAPRRNPIARALRVLRPKVRPSGKVYSRKRKAARS